MNEAEILEMAKAAQKKIAAVCSAGMWNINKIDIGAFARRDLPDIGAAKEVFTGLHKAARSNMNIDGVAVGLLVANVLHAIG